MSSNPDLKSIMLPKNIALIALAKSILDGAGIIYVVNNEYLSHAYGTGGFGLGEIEIKVESSRFEEAKLLLADIDNIEEEKDR